MTICAMLGVGMNTIFYRPKEKSIHADTAHKLFYNMRYGDHFTLLTIYQQWESNHFNTDWCFQHFIQYRSMKRAKDIREQLMKMLQRIEIDFTTTTNEIAICKALTSGYFLSYSKVR